jgi:uncharacterized protein (TIGR00369 family)
MAKGGTSSAPDDAHPLVKKVFDSKPPIAKLIGFEIELISSGHAVTVLEAGPQHANPMGTVHGGVLCDLADAAMGMAFASTLEHDESFTTMDLTMNFFRPVWTAKLRAAAHVVTRGRTVGYIECEIVSDGDKLIAKASSTCFVLRGEQSKQR